MTDDRDDRPNGFLHSIRTAVATWLAAPPEPPSVWTPPRGLGLLPGLWADVAAARGKVKAIARDADGVSLLKAEEWYQRAGLPPAVGCIAVLLASESSMRYIQYPWAIGEACIHAARATLRPQPRLGPGPLDLGYQETLEDALVRRIVGDKRPERNGRFGPQGGRWASTAQQPNVQHVRMAELLWEKALVGAPPIISKGTTQWTDQRTQVLMHAKKPATNPDPETLMRRRYESGQRWEGPCVDATGEVVLDPWILTLLGPDGVPLESAMAMLADGRRRWRMPS